jgi:hypothetical protein
MSDVLTKALIRREQILTRMRVQRERVADSIRALAGPIALVDRVAHAGRLVRAHPAAAGVIVATVVAMRTRSLLSLGRRALSLWRTLRGLRSLINRFG